ncbi:uncharacterized protein BJ171DRAFT_277063 [Polychytrium aggregatum]|uniref:uncharacterized protein n=1 Tax=Polychytrium aggregatum TaxID=110093 RepID=UPI0022FF0F19|nr:uncharacterized protein BJ171DRAFT_277063 [Polychytrium aggregatum]KAI9207525.1 hypothetical protein BJ171DRAFT_277063 [Polychytrium aggregatum]
MRLLRCCWGVVGRSGMTCRSLSPERTALTVSSVGSLEMRATGSGFAVGLVVCGAMPDQAPARQTPDSGDSVWVARSVLPHCIPPPTSAWLWLPYASQNPSPVGAMALSSTLAAGRTAKGIQKAVSSKARSAGPMDVRRHEMTPSGIAAVGPRPAQSQMLLLFCSCSAPALLCSCSRSSLPISSRNSSPPAKSLLNMPASTGFSIVHSRLRSPNMISQTIANLFTSYSESNHIPPARRTPSPASRSDSDYDDDDLSTKVQTPSPSSSPRESVASIAPLSARHTPVLPGEVRFVGQTEFVSLAEEDFFARRVCTCTSKLAHHGVFLLSEEDARGF